jgi:monovalent cation/hydrogen antiporter
LISSLQHIGVNSIEQIFTYIILFAIIVVIGQLFDKSPVPLPLLLVVTGMLLSFIPGLAAITINPDLVLNIFLPILVYQISAFLSWKDFKKNVRPIALLSVGHVLFITIIVAVIIHKMLPQLGWPLAVVIGAIVSPPDDVAIVAMAEKIRLPEKIITILEGEGMLNDAAALTIFRFALAAVVTHQFLFVHAGVAFFLDIVAETFYGLLVGYIVGELRLKITSAPLHVIASLLTPFLAYCPAVMLGGCGIIATVATGFMIGHIYALRFTSGFRLIGRAMWPSLSTGVQSLLFLLAGHNLLGVVRSIDMIPLAHLFLYSGVIIAAVIIGRFVWVYGNIYIPRGIFSTFHKENPRMPWQHPFLVSWAGMRGSISLAAALAVPFLPGMVEGANTRNFLIFLVFSVIMATLLLQGLALPWLVKVIGVEKITRCEEYGEHLAELKARKRLAKVGLHRLVAILKEEENSKMKEEIRFWIQHYRMVKSRLKERIDNHGKGLPHDEEAEISEDVALGLELIEVESKELMELWRKEKINLSVRNKLLDQLDHRAKNLK